MTLATTQLQADRLRRFVDWNAVQFRPKIGRGEEIYELPRPVSLVGLKETWDAERFKTLLVDGDTSVGSTRNGVDITVSGVIGSTESALMTPAELFAALADLREQVHVGPDDVKYRFFLLHDADASLYQFFQACSTVRLETDFRHMTAIQYRLVIHADDPMIYDDLE